MPANEIRPRVKIERTVESSRVGEISKLATGKERENASVAEAILLADLNTR